MSYSILIHDDLNELAQVNVLRGVIFNAPRNTVTVTTNDHERAIMRDPKVLVNIPGDRRLFLADHHNVIYLDDVQFVEVYDPHPDFNSEAV